MLRIVHDVDAGPEIGPLDLDQLCRLAEREMLAWPWRPMRTGA